MATHYQVLGIAAGATHDEIKRAYHRMARRHHPDTHAQASADVQDSARRTMVDINAAWAVLGDAARRREYDADLAPPRPSAAAAAAADAPDGATAPEGYPDWFEPDDQVPAAHLEEDLHQGQRGPGELIVFVPVGLAAMAVATFATAMVVQWPALFAVSILLVPLALVAFMAAPFVAMATRGRSRPARD
ncbi:MAG: J domain-containing protein [Acidimicrobiales bacterium]